MGSFMSLTLLEKRNKLVNVAKLFIVLDDILEVIWVNNYILSAEISCSEFLCSDASEANSFPNFGYVCPLGGIVSLNVFLIHNKHLGQFLIVLKFCENDFGSFVHFEIEAFVSNLHKICLVWLTNKVLKVNQAFFTALSICKNKLRVNCLLLERLACHQKIRNEVLVAIFVVRQRDDSQVHLWILSLNKTVDTFSKHVPVELSFTEFRVHFLLACLFSKLLCALDVVKFMQDDFDCLD